MIDKLKGKNIIITGASSGIGKALAIECAKIGANVALAARSADKLEALKNELEAYSVKIVSVPTDVSIESDCTQLIKTTHQELGGIDFLYFSITLAVPLECSTLYPRSLCPLFLSEPRSLLPQKVHACLCLHY